MKTALKISISIIYILSSSVLASSQDELCFTFSEILSKVNNYDIEIVDWQKVEKAKKYEFPKSELKTQKAWLDVIKIIFGGSYALVDDGPKKRVFLLPKGIEACFLKSAKEFSRESEQSIALANEAGGKAIQFEDINSQPEIIRLKEFSDFERKKTLCYQRLVNPERFSEAYSFKVKYFESIGNLAPFERNGLLLKGKMIGFNSFSTVCRYLDEAKGKGQFTRNGDLLYFTIKNGLQAQLSLVIVGGEMEITTIVQKNGERFMETLLSGSASAFQVVSRIHSPSGLTTLVDDAQAL